MMAGQKTTLNTFPMSVDIRASFAERFHFHEANHGLDVVMVLRELYGDITIKARDKEIKAHRKILSFFSQYFRTMFNSGIKDEHVSTVDLSYLDGEILGKVLDFGYTGEIDIQGENIFDILSMANFLGMDSLVRGCCTYLADNMNLDNCLGVLKAADDNGCLDLYEATKIVVLRSFVDTCKDDRFRQLSPELVLKLINDENIVVVKNNLMTSPCQQELEIWTVIESYIQYDLLNRKQWLPKFLEYIRLPLIDSQYLEKIEKSSLIREDSTCRELVEKAKLLSRSKDGTETPWTVPRKFADHRFCSTPPIANLGIVKPELISFDDREIVDKDNAHVEGLDLFIRLWDGKKVLGGVRVIYSNGKEKTYGDDKGMEKHSIRLQKCERITDVKAVCGWMVDCLLFYTNLGRCLGPFGGDGGGKYDVSISEAFAYLAAISGTVVLSQNLLGITRLSFHFRYYQFPEPPALLKHRSDLMMPKQSPKA